MALFSLKKRNVTMFFVCAVKNVIAKSILLTPELRTVAVSSALFSIPMSLLPRESLPSEKSWMNAALQETLALLCLNCTKGSVSNARNPVHHVRNAKKLFMNCPSSLNSEMPWALPETKFCPKPLKLCGEIDPWTRPARSLISTKPSGQLQRIYFRSIEFCVWSWKVR